MTQQQQYILRLLDSALCGKQQTVQQDILLEQILPLIRAQHLEHLVYYGAANCGFDTRSPVMQELFKYTYKYMLADHRQMQQLKMLGAVFSANGIHYMPLKGMVLKNLYPKSDMRIMGDADLLIKMDQYDRICQVMEQLGYSFQAETDHELIWTKSCLRIELHKRLIPSYNYDYMAYYGDGWQLAHPTAADPCCFAMTDEDQLIYLITHLAKHYRDGGIGIRHMLDLYLYKQAKTDLDEAYIAKQLQKLQLHKFYQNIYHTLQVWFHGANADTVTDLITKVVFESGCFGTRRFRTVAQGIRNKAKYGDSTKTAQIRTLVRLVFLPYEIMEQKYPILRTVPVLLPVMWVVRWLEALLSKPKVISKHCKQVKLLTQDELNLWEQQLNEVGLAFHFEEK